ncbi:hypothetical protein CsSME_00036926 [Camellia sinensis var. sinensis]
MMEVHCNSFQRYSINASVHKQYVIFSSRKNVSIAMTTVEVFFSREFTYYRLHYDGISWNPHYILHMEVIFPNVSFVLDYHLDGLLLDYWLSQTTPTCPIHSQTRIPIACALDK